MLFYKKTALNRKGAGGKPPLFCVFPPLPPFYSLLSPFVFCSAQNWKRGCTLQWSTVARVLPVVIFSICNSYVIGTLLLLHLLATAPHLRHPKLQCRLPQRLLQPGSNFRVYVIHSPFLAFPGKIPHIVHAWCLGLIQVWGLDAHRKGARLFAGILFLRILRILFSLVFSLSISLLEEGTKNLLLFFFF